MLTQIQRRLLYLLITFILVRLWRAFQVRKRNQRLLAHAKERLFHKWSTQINDLAVPVEDEMRVLKMTVCELRRALDQGEFTATQLMSMYIRRCAHFGRLLNATTYEFFTQAMKAAKECDERRGAGIAPRLLEGIPVSIKDCFSQAGVENTCGLASRVGVLEESDSVCVKLLLDAGAIPLARTNVPPTLMAWETANNVFGNTMNPWNPARITGGSSGGEAALIAVGASPLGIGSDIGGSVRLPAHCCGLYSLKVTTRRVSTLGMGCQEVPGQTIVLSSPGPMGKSVDDLVLVMKAWIGVEDSQESKNCHLFDPYSPPCPFRNNLFNPRKITPLRIGILAGNNVFAPSPPCARAMNEAITYLRSLPDVTVVTFNPPKNYLMARYWLKKVFVADNGQWLAKVLAGEIAHPVIADGATLGGVHTRVADALGWLLQRSRITHRLGTNLRATFGRPIGSAAEMFALNEQIIQFQREFLKAFDGLDALLCPTIGVPAPRHGQARKLRDALYTGIFNLLQWPAGHVPITTVRADECYYDEELHDIVSKIAAEEMKGAQGLPVGIQVAAPPFQDETVLRIMKILEHKFPFVFSPMAYTPVPGECKAEHPSLPVSPQLSSASMAVTPTTKTLLDTTSITAKISPTSTNATTDILTRTSTLSAPTTSTTSTVPVPNSLVTPTSTSVASNSTLETSSPSAFSSSSSYTSPGLSSLTTTLSPETITEAQQPENTKASHSAKKGKTNKKANKDITPLPPAKIISVTPSHREQSRKAIENNKQAKKNKSMSLQNNFAKASSPTSIAIPSLVATTTNTTMTSPTPLDTSSPVNPIKSFSPQPDPLTITITPSSATHAGEMSADPSHRDLSSHSLALSPKSTSNGIVKSESGASLPPAELPIVECPSTARLISPHDLDGIDIKSPLTEDPLSPPSSVRFEQQEYTPSSISSYPVTPNERDSVSAEECPSTRSLSRASNRELRSREEEEQKMREHEMAERKTKPPPKKVISDPNEYVKFLENPNDLVDEDGLPLEIEVDGLYGRLTRGNKPEDFTRLSCDTWKRLSWVIGPADLAIVVQRAQKEPLGVILTHFLGMLPQWVKSYVDKGHYFRLLVFSAPPGSAWPATWDGVKDAVRTAYPDVNKAMTTHFVALKSTPWAEVERLAGFNFLEVSIKGRNTDPRYMSYERLVAIKNPSFLEVRSFLYFEIGVKELFKGDGFARSTDGERGAQEFLVKTVPLDQLRYSWFDVDMKVAFGNI